MRTQACARHLSAEFGDKAADHAGGDWSGVAAGALVRGLVGMVALILMKRRA